MEAVGIAVLGGGCGTGEIRGVGLKVGGVVADAVRSGRVVEEDGKVVDTGEVVEGREEGRETGVASADVAEGVTVAATVVTTVDAEDVDVFSGVTISGRLG